MTLEIIAITLLSHSLSHSLPLSHSLLQVMDRMCQVLHTKAEDLRIHDFADEEHPLLLDDEEKTVSDLDFSDNHKLLIESKAACGLCVHRPFCL